MPPHLPMTLKKEIAHEIKAGTKQVDILKTYPGLSKGALSRIVADLDYWLNIDDGTNSKKKRVEKSKLDGLDEKVMQFLMKAREHNCAVTGAIPLDVAKRRAEKLGYNNFKASHGWLEGFKIRNQIVNKMLTGEKASAPKLVAEEYVREVLPEILSHYEPENIFNADETGLYWEQTSNTSMMLKGEDSSGKKKSKKRLTVLLICSMAGKLEPLILINSHLHPRAFRKIRQDLKRLPPCLKWRASKKGWMNHVIFRECLISLNSKLKRGTEKVSSFWIIFLDMSWL